MNGSNMRGYGRSNNQRRNKTTNIDLVLVIDATGSMDDCIQTVKENAYNLYDDLCAAIAKEGIRTVHQMRIRVIAFRDYVEYDNEKAKYPRDAAEWNAPMMATNFFNMPEERDKLRDALNSIEAVGGGDDDEDALEALAFAIRSNWIPETEGIDRRQVIVLWTDADAHSLGFGKGSSCYPKTMVEDMEALKDWWGEKDSYYAATGQKGVGYMGSTSKRLLLFAPGKKTIWNGPTQTEEVPTVWNEISQWGNTQWVETVKNQFNQSLNAVQRAAYYNEQIILPLVKTIMATPVQGGWDNYRKKQQ